MHLCAKVRHGEMPGTLRLWTFPRFTNLVQRDDQIATVRELLKAGDSKSQPVRAIIRTVSSVSNATRSILVSFTTVFEWPQFFGMLAEVR
jgi:hypothetical protein